mmetsp:Transcript_53333/g.105176  ORF Transcript_53333/g.105176 Transcript_53333/m.105176 type:complete len:256 (+) Transcript_53333:652-1419(+)
MLGHPVGLVQERLDDETDSVRRQALDALLDHMIPMLVLDALQHHPFQFADEQHLLLDGHGVQRLLHNPAAVHVQRQLEHLANKLFGEDPPLFCAPVLEKLLDDVIPEHIRRQQRHFLQHRLEGDRFLLFAGHFQLLLDQPGAILVLGNVGDVGCQIAELDIPIFLPQLLDQRVARPLPDFRRPGFAATPAAAASATAGGLLTSNVLAGCITASPPSVAFAPAASFSGGRCSWGRHGSEHLRCHWPAAGHLAVLVP